MAIELRPVVPADQALLLRIYRSTRADELAQTGWDEAVCERFVQMQFDAQRRHYTQQRPRAEHSIVIWRDAAGVAHEVGRLWVDREGDTLHVLDIAVLPAWRGQGIGTRCLRRLMNEAQERGLALTIYVEHGNPARRLYERLGFMSNGEPVGIHQRMQWHHEETCDEQA